MLPRLRKQSRLRPGEVVSLTRLDELLDVDVHRFESEVQSLTREFRRKRATIDVPSPLVSTSTAEKGSRADWPRLFEIYAEGMAIHDRAEEFRFARRHEFVKARARAALVEHRFRDDAMALLLRHGRERLGEPPRRTTAAERAYLDRVLEEFVSLRNRYVEGFLFLVTPCVHRYRHLGADPADLIQEGAASLFQAIDGFDWRRDVRFKTYAQYWIHQAMLKLLYNTSRTVRLPVWLQKQLGKIRRIEQDVAISVGRLATDEEVGARLDLPATRVRHLRATRRYAKSLDAEVVEDGGRLAQLLVDDRALPAIEFVQEGDLGATLDEAMADLPKREHSILTRRFGLHGHEPETLGAIAADLGITAERVRQLQKAAINRLQRPHRAQRLRSFVG